MITVEEASARIAAAVPVLPPCRVAPVDAVGRVLAEPVAAERDQPPFDRVTMDGIAVRHDTGATQWVLHGRAFAGEPRHTLAAAAGAIEVMTGAPLPAGADTVIPVEAVTIADGVARLQSGGGVTRGQFVHRRASDHAAGRQLLAPGVEVGAAEVAVLVSAGLTQVAVGGLPSVRIVATGDELVAAGEPVADHQIRLSNGPAIEAALRARRVSDVASLHLSDEPGLLRRHLADIVAGADITILSGGVSMGKADHVPAVLRDLGVREIFHRVSQRPGKPLWFGVGGNGALVFGLPGNPVSALVGFRRYVAPAIERMAGLAEVALERATLATDTAFEPPLTAFVPVTLGGEQGPPEATPVPFNTSGDFASLAGTDGFVELPKDRSNFSRGESFAFYRW